MIMSRGSEERENDGRTCVALLHVMAALLFAAVALLDVARLCRRRGGVRGKAEENEGRRRGRGEG